MPESEQLDAPQKSSSRTDLFSNISRQLSRLRPQRHTDLDWQHSNELLKGYNQKDLEKRQKEIMNSPLSEYYKGDIMGMQIFEGPIVMRDESSGNEELLTINTRIIVSREMHLPTFISPQHIEYSPVNDTLLSALYYDVTPLVFNGSTKLLSSDYAKGKHYEHSNEIFGELIGRYKDIQKVQDDYPLTIIFAHGSVNEKNEHLINSGASEVYSTNLFLDNVISRFPPPKGVDQVPVVLSSCNETEGRNASVYNPHMMIGYRRGIVRMEHNDSETKISK